MTNYLREAFVRAAMDDVPNVDYHEKIRSLVNKQVARYLKIAGAEGVNVARLCNNYQSIAGQSYYMRGLTDEECTKIRDTAEIKELTVLHNQQKERRTILKNTLTSAIGACNTRKQAAEALPEFEKYLPADTPAAMRSLPALANVVSDFVKAGWPKNQKRIKAVVA